MALIKKQLLAKEDMLLSADNTPVSQARAGTIISVHPVNASVIPFDETKSIVEAVEDLAYTHPSKHPVSIIDGSSNPSKFVKTDTLGNTGFDIVTWAEVAGKPSTYTPSSHEHSLDEVTSGSLAASRIIVSETRQFITAEQATQLLEMEVKSNKGMPNGYAPLDSNGKINSSFLSDLNLVEVFTPADLASMLALTSAQPGDIAYRQDNSTSYMLVALPASTEANWKSLNTGSQIISVNGQTGVVSLNTSNIAESTNLYFTNERVDDRVANLLQAGTNISLAYDDTSNTLTINANVTKTQVGLGNVDNTSDINKPISTATQNALDLKAPLASPALTGTPTAPTATVGDSSTQLATTAFVNAEIANDTYSKTEIDTKLAAQNDASEIRVTPSGNLVSTNAQTALEELQGAINELDSEKAIDTAVVHKTGDETIAGVKTFSSSPLIPSAITGGQAIRYDQSVKLSGDETIAGVKTFSSSPIVPTPTTDTQAVNKIYVDTKVAKVTSIDNSIVRFNGTTGEVQNSSVFINDNGNLLVGTSVDNGINKLQVNGSISVVDIINTISSSNTTPQVTIEAVRTNDNSGGANILYSLFGDVPTCGELYVQEVGTDKYLNATFYKRGESYPPVVTVLASNGLTIGVNNVRGTQVINGATNNYNVRMMSKIRKIYT